MNGNPIKNDILCNISPHNTYLYGFFIGLCSPDLGHLVADCLKISISSADNLSGISIILSPFKGSTMIV